MARAARYTLATFKLPDERARATEYMMQGFQARADAELADGQFNATASFEVPAGQELTAQFISVKVMVPPGQTIQVSFNAGGGATGGFVPMQAGGTTFTPFGPLVVWVGALSILDFSTGFFSVELARGQPSQSAAPGAGFLSAFVSGQLAPSE